MTGRLTLWAVAAAVLAAAALAGAVSDRDLLRHRLRGTGDAANKPTVVIDNADTTTVTATAATATSTTDATAATTTATDATATAETTGEVVGDGNVVSEQTSQVGAQALSMPENSVTKAVRQILLEDQGHEMAPWRFFYSENSNEGGPLIVFWLRGGAPDRVPRYKGTDGGGLPGNLVYGDLALVMETDRFDAVKYREVNYAYGWAAHKKWRHCFGTANARGGRVQLLVQPHELAAHGAGIAAALARRGVPAASFRLAPALVLNGAAHSLTQQLQELREGEHQNFGYCDGGPGGELQPVLTVWPGRPVHIPHDAANRQAFVREAIQEHVPDESRTCLIGDVKRLEGDSSAFATHVEFRLFADDAPAQLILRMEKDLKRYYGGVPSAFPADHAVKRADVNVRGAAASGWPALWGAQVLTLERPKPDAARTAYAVALGNELARLLKMDVQLGHAQYASKVATVRYYDQGAEGGLPLLLVGNMKEADYLKNDKARGDTVRGYMQTSMEGGFVRIAVTQGTPIARLYLRGALSESIGGLLVDGEAGDAILRLRHAKVEQADSRVATSSTATTTATTKPKQ